MKVTRKSDLTGNESSMELDVTQEQLDATTRCDRPRAELLFPNLSINECLFVFTGITEEELQRNSPHIQVDKTPLPKAELKTVRINIGNAQTLVLSKSCPLDLLVEAHSFLVDTPNQDSLPGESARDYRTTRETQMHILGVWIENRLREPREYCKPILIQSDWSGPETYQHFDLSHRLMLELWRTGSNQDRYKVALWADDNLLRRFPEPLEDREPQGPAFNRNAGRTPSADRTPARRRRRKRFL